MSIKQQQVLEQNSTQNLEKKTVDIAIGSACENIRRKTECGTKNSATGINNANSIPFTAVNGLHCIHGCLSESDAHEI